MDGPGSSQITDHPFSSPVGEPWARCQVCSLSEAAHADTRAPYQVQGEYRCPRCVQTDTAFCSHAPERVTEMLA